MIRPALLAAACAGFTLLPLAANATPVVETLVVDASDAARQVWHAQLRVPAVAGDTVLVFPKWKPGNHAPTGQVANLGLLRASAGGADVRWTRDPNDPYAFHFAVPTAADALDVGFDFYEGTSRGGDLTAQLAVLDWNTVVLYPRDAAGRDVQVSARIELPAGWTAATALPFAVPQPAFGTPGGTLTFAPVSLETLIDSPLYCGAYERVVPLADAGGMTSEVDLFGESAFDVEPVPAQVRRWKRLVAEADALFGARHWRHYHFLVTLSDAEMGRGVEHHESSANGLPERYLSDADLYAAGASLLPHEYVHSWNGKYRRPAGLIVDNFQRPQNDELLWVYEGLTQYFGIVLAARSGLAEPGALQDTLAAYYAQLDAEPGRRSRPLADTAKMQVVARVTPGAPGGFYQRRGSDYYDEGALLWLDADTLIRERSRGRRSLDDLARRFFGGTPSGPEVVGYTREDVIAALNAVLPYDWARFFRTRVDDVAVHPPLDGIRRGGWAVAYTAERTERQIRSERATRGIDATYSLGSSIAADGTVPFTIEGMPLARAGVAAGAKILAVDDRSFTPERLRLALRAARSSPAPMRLTLDDLGSIATVDLPYHGGERYPRLVRRAGTPDRLTAIAAPRTAR